MGWSSFQRDWWVLLIWLSWADSRLSWFSGLFSPGTQRGRFGKWIRPRSYIRRHLSQWKWQGYSGRWSYSTSLLFGRVLRRNWALQGATGPCCLGKGSWTFSAPYYDHFTAHIDWSHEIPGSWWRDCAILTGLQGLQTSGQQWRAVSLICGLGLPRDCAAQGCMKTDLSVAGPIPVRKVQGRGRGIRGLLLHCAESDVLLAMQRIPFIEFSRKAKY